MIFQSCIFVYNSFQESDSPPSSNVAINLHPLTLAPAHSVIQMATDLRVAHPAGFIHNTPQVLLCFAGKKKRLSKIQDTCFNGGKIAFSSLFLGPDALPRKPNHAPPL